MASWLWRTDDLKPHPRGGGAPAIRTHTLEKMLAERKEAAGIPRWDIDELTLALLKRNAADLARGGSAFD